MAFPDKRAITSIVLYDEDGNQVGLVEKEGIYRLQSDSHTIPIDSEGHLITEDIVFVEYLATVSVDGPTFLMVIDLDNSNGDYPHAETGGVQILSGRTIIDKDVANAEWVGQLGVIVDINGTQATIALLAFGNVTADKTDTFRSVNAFAPSPIAVPLKVVSNDLVKILTNNGLVTTALNTGTPIPDPAGNSVTPAIGDIVSVITRVSGTGSAQYDVSFAYRTVV